MERKFTILRPGGNDTALIAGIVTDPAERKSINDKIMQFYPNVEQVGFVETKDPDNLQLVMAGGEFCGNATRSTVYEALKGKPGQVRIRVSGVDRKLKAGINDRGEAYSQMPVYKEADKVMRDPEDEENFLVEMEGITHLIRFKTDEVSTLNEDQIKEDAFKLMKQKDLLKFPAAGVMYAEKTPKGYKIYPVVYVRDIDTLFFETACGSGTTALGLVLAKVEGKSLTDVPVYQPSGLPIKISVKYDGQEFSDAQICGPIDPLTEGSLCEVREFTFTTEKISTSRQLRTALYEKGLVKLYKDIFSGPPYFEKFSDKEVENAFAEYLNKGVLFLANNEKTVIGFGAALPLSTDENIAKLAAQFGIDIQNTWYMADLGVSPRYRRYGIAEKLVRARLDYFDIGTMALMRTSEQNIPSQSLYTKLGFKPVEGMEQQVCQARIDGMTKVDRRVFFIKETKK